MLHSLLLFSLFFLVSSRRNPLDCFIVSTDHALLGTAFAAPRVPNLQACLTQCLKRNKCRSLLYYRAKNVCVLNSQTKDERKSGFVSTKGLSESSDYYERTCYDRTRAVARAASTAKECFSVESGKVLIGIVDQQIKNVKTLEKCMKACEDSKRKSERICKSAMYYEKEQECIIASQNKSDSPDLFIDDDNSVYLENKCYAEEGTTTAVPMESSTTAAPIVLDSAPEVEVEDVLITTEAPTTAPPKISTVSTGNGKSKLPVHLVLPELVSPPLLNAENPPVEASGYIIAPQYKVTKSMAEVKKGEIVPQHVVDTYGVEPKRDEKKPAKKEKEEAAIVQPLLPLLVEPPTNDVHTRKLRHPAVKDCFSEIPSINPGSMTGRVVKAYSLEQCVDICRLCNRCLRRKPCVTVAFHENAYSCGLSSEQAGDNETTGLSTEQNKSILRMEENDVRHLSTDELRTQSEELRAQFAEKQKVLLEVKSKINRGKLSSVNNATERTLSAFLRSCCEETEKEQSYVSEVIDRVRTTADHARANLERVNEHAHDLLRNVDNDVLELQDNLQRVHSGYAQLSTVLEQRALKGGQLRQREEHIGMSSLTQMERAEKVFSRIGVHFDSQISRLESVLAQRTQEDCCAQQEQVDLEREAEKAETVLTTFNDEDQALTNQLQKAENEFDHLQTQLTSRNKAKECAESDQVRIEMEVSELREAAESMFESISSKRITIEENEEKITQLSDELLEVNEIIISTENELKLFEESLFMLHDTAKKESEELMHTLELELEDVSTQLSTGIIRADLMDQMFGNDLKLSSQDWINLIEKSRSEKSSNQMVSDARAILLVSLDNVKAELENVRQEAKTELGEYNMAQSRVRNLKRRVEEDRESRQTNIRMAEARLAQAKKELEELTNAKCNDSCAVLVTPNPARHSSLQNQKIACVGVSRGLSDDSDVESVKKSVINLPDGIVKRNAATQQCSTLRSPDDSQNDPLEDGAVDGGVSTETTVATNPDGDGDVTMEGIPLSVSVDHAVLDDRIGTWVRETPSDNNSPASGSTGEMMENRFPENIFNETNALNETDITMDMEDNDLNMSLMEMPPTMTIKTVSPPPVRHASSKSSIFVNDSDSDANASVWDDEF